MHSCLSVDEFLRSLMFKLVQSGSKATAVSFARCWKNFEDPVLDVLLGVQDQLILLLECLPEDVWEEGNGNLVSWFTILIFSGGDHQIQKSSRRIPTKWNGVEKCTLRAQKLKVAGIQ